MDEVSGRRGSMPPLHVHHVDHEIVHVPDARSPCTTHFEGVAQLERETGYRVEILGPRELCPRRMRAWSTPS